MDLSSFASGVCFGVPLGMGLLYLLTHPDQRKSIASRIHALFAKTPPTPPAA